MSSSQASEHNNSSESTEQQNSTTHQRLKTSPLASNLNTYQPACSHVNMILIGEIGGGKSSLISTFHRALHPQLTSQSPIAGIGLNRTTAFTKKIKYYVLNEASTIITHDTKGLETLMRPELEHVRAIRDGKIRDDVEVRQKQEWTVWDYLMSIVTRNPDAILDPDCLRNEQADILDIPHAVIFVVPANQRKIPTELTNFVHLFVEYGYMPLFAVTKIDCHGAEKGDLYAATNLYDTKKEEIMKRFDFVDYDMIKPVQNYTQWDKRDLSIENLALNLLQKAVLTSEMFIDRFVQRQKEYEE
eukprot:CAMPEP_0117445494 /NCGR_PEP_ID=MMETSP0759-20121206/5827_1 /TAXON_ID=63605 /ORGANISM="Percolomonas cosmopolitus, Strain WS" /LENGTH=300 /DNA_ID=CAMNT_0005237677 /DNA_START=221 /DNA_END=1120 /DNA_ORIENTATION=+